MYLDIDIRCPTSALFDVPHQCAPIRFQTLCKEFPEFVKLFDGQSKENTLLFYWKWNKRYNVFEFIDAKAEEVIATLMGVKYMEYNNEDTGRCLD